MAIFKCKMCGGDILLSADKTFGTCENCGTSMTFPKGSDEQRLAMFNRGNEFRRAGEFDKALALYENILREDDTDAEAHWCCALCRFGIEYVEDPATFEYIPTCHRASFDSFLDDIDYKAAVENADGITKRQYQKDAVKISDVQKRILATSQNEEPFDIFICYKETDDATGQRTRDSIDAQEIYYQLTNEGYRVFFSRITLEGKAGAEYEPYIFAALNSAKVMIVIGSKVEYFNAVWVKNEWSRFLAMMRKDKSKLLLPCYRDITPYDLPEQLSVLQSYDMSKIGFIQDLIRGVGKIVSRNEPKAAAAEKITVAESADFNAIPLLKRAFLFLEDGNWAEADEYCEKVLDRDPENAEAYLGKLMAELKIKTRDGLKNAKEPFEENGNALKAGRFDPAIAKEINAANEIIRERNETEYITRIYNNAVTKMNTAKSEKEFRNAAEAFAKVSGFKDADEKAGECLEKAETARKDEIYNCAVEKMNEPMPDFGTGYLQSAIRMFESIIDWKDSRTKADECITLIADLKTAAEKAEEERKNKEEEKRIAAEKRKAKVKRSFMIGGPLVAALIAFVIVLNFIIIPNQKLSQAVALISSKEYDNAYSILEELEKNIIIKANMYEKATEFAKLNNIDAAIILFDQCSGYKDSDTKLSEFASEYFKSITNDLKTGEIIKLGKYPQGNETDKEYIEWQVLEIKDNKALLISKKALDCIEFNDEFDDVTWETSSIRKWLNETFINEAFNIGEQVFISKTNIPAHTNPKYEKYLGYDTNDKIFLLSITEVEKYFNSEESRVCFPTNYAISKGINLNKTSAINGDYPCWWWLRTTGEYYNYATLVGSRGGINNRGYNVDNSGGGIRPAMWIDI